MNQKSWALISVAFIAGIMILSSFAGFVMRGGSGPAPEDASDASWSLAQFGVGGRLIDWDFGGMGDALGMYPENLAIGYWIDLTASEELTSAASLALPPSVGLIYGDTLYPTEIERMSWGLFGDDVVEFHWIKPYRLGTYGMAIPHDGYQMIPFSTDVFRVIGMPTLFGTQPAVETALDVIAGVSPTTDEFVLPYEETDDLQVSILGEKIIQNPNIKPPLGGEYEELYLGASDLDGRYKITAKYISPYGDAEKRATALAQNHGLEVSADDGMISVSGIVNAEDLMSTLGAFLAP